jgi:hypothetical protein
MNWYNTNQINQLFQQQNQPQPQNEQFNQQQFSQLVLNLDKTALINLVQRARQQGIPEQEIETGLNYILNLKNQRR